ncbi:DUF6199 family natural product biosynthesis protein [Fusibacter sp. JL298sf-3]
MNLFGKLVLSLVLALGIVNPKLFLKVTEFWRVTHTRERSEMALKMTRILSAVALIFFWVMPLVYKS